MITLYATVAHGWRLTTYFGVFSLNKNYWIIGYYWSQFLQIKVFGMRCEVLSREPLEVVKEPLEVVKTII